MMDFEALKDAITDILSHHQMAVSKVGAKHVFAVLKKGQSTGYNEMNPAFAMERIEFMARPEADRPAQTHKLDLVDFMLGMVMTKDVTPLILLNSFFNIISFQPPDVTLDEAGLLELLQRVNKEYFDVNNEVMDRLKDGVFDCEDAKVVSKESMHLINVGAQLKYFSDKKISETSGYAATMENR
nr:phage regulatory CII family protein [uncultured Desulfobacter sp.]